MLALDFFIAGVPAGPIFMLELQEMRKLVTSSANLKLASNSCVEICLVGICSYFEAFCKAQFASVINSCPQVLTQFVEKRPSVALEVRDVLPILKDLHYKLGSLLAERYDFGSSDSINGLYRDLLSISPFSRRDAQRYRDLLNDRNLLVHHGGVYTYKYAGQKFAARVAKGSAHWDSLVVHPADFFRRAAFLEAMVRKITAATHKALANFVRAHRIALKPERKKAMDYLQWAS
jgi:hypothetical protein